MLYFISINLQTMTLKLKTLFYKSYLKPILEK
ncbi:Uncharacterised protein [Mycobacteroides abscessus subsp. massiliense]|nr:Uncharacterised protein [Mycobacteroides abscessus subsp. massiliense]